MQKITIAGPSCEITIEADNERELIKQAAFWQSIPRECPICHSQLILNYRTPQTFEYYELRCVGTASHSINFGESKGTHNLYFDQKKQWKAYAPNSIDQSDEPVFTHPPAATPSSALHDRGLAATNASQSIGALKNRLIKLIQKSKDAGIRTGLLPADVAGMSESEILTTTEGLSRKLAKEGVAIG